MLLKNLTEDWRLVLAALYLPGSPHGLALSKKLWPAVLGSLRTAAASIVEAESTLRAKGHFAEAAVLTHPQALAYAKAALAEGRVLTALDEGYPERWRTVLGASAPPVVWCHGVLPSAISWFGMVGSRSIPADIHRFCAATARQVVAQGYGVVSGGASGCDATSAQAAQSPVLVILPYGLNLLDSREPYAFLSVCPPDEPFSTARAMERNLLIYTAGAFAFVGHSRYREGGTWNGATHALRRRVTRLIVRQDRHDPAHRALAALGALELAHPEDLPALLRRPSVQPDLFGSDPIAVENVIHIAPQERAG